MKTIAMAGAVICLLAGSGSAWAEPRQVSNEPSTESFSGNAERNWSSVGFEGAYASVLNASETTGYGVGVNAAFIRASRLGRASFGFDVDAIVHFLSAPGSKTESLFLMGAGPAVKVYPLNALSLTLMIRPGISVMSNGSSRTDFALSEALFVEAYITPQVSVGVGPTWTEVWTENPVTKDKEVQSVFHGAVLVNFNY